MGLICKPAPASCTAANAASPSANRIRTVLALRFSVPYASEPLPSRHFFSESWHWRLSRQAAPTTVPSHGRRKGAG